MAEVAALAHVDVAGNPVSSSGVYGLMPSTTSIVLFEIEQRRDFDEAADRDHREDTHDEGDDRTVLEDLMSGPE